MGTPTLVRRPPPKAAAKVKSPAKPAAGVADEGMQRLVGQLVERARQIHAGARSHQGPALPPPSGREEVLLDIELGGVRCLVLQAEPLPDPEMHAPQRDVLVLSPREQEIVRMVSKGYPNKTIAAVLEISTWTVATYLRRVYARLGVGTRASMVARVMESSARELS